MMIRTRAPDFSLTPFIRERVESRVKSAVEPVGDRVIIVTARLEDVNASRGGIDKRCRFVAGLRKTGIVAAEATDIDLYAAIDRAAARLRRAVLTATRRQVSRDRRRRLSRAMLVGA
jgi:ribosome-associated translation inhibitor RaiA